MSTRFLTPDQPETRTAGAARSTSKAVFKRLDLEEFFESFDVVAAARLGIDRLRELVLDLAVRGLLTRADTTCAPATSDGLIVSEEEYLSARVSQKDDLLRAVPMPGENWIRTKLGNIVQLAYGKSLPRKARNERGVIPTYGSNGPVGVHDEELVGEPCLVVGRKGSSGAVNMVHTPCWPIDTTFYVLAPPGLSLRFLFIVLRALRLSRFDRAMAIPGLNRADAYALTVLIPPVAEQDRIVAKAEELMRVLDELEIRQAKMRSTHGLLRQAALGALVRATDDNEFKARWETVAENFDVLCASAESVGDLKAAILGLGLKGHFNRRSLGEETGGGPPRGWWRGPLGDLATFVTSGSRNWKNYYAASGAVFVRSQDIKTDALDLSSPAFVTVPADTEGTRTRIKRNDVLVTITGANVGKVALVDREIPEAYVSQHIALVRLRDVSLGRWVQRWLASPHNGRSQLKDSSYGDKPGLNLNQVRSVSIDIPPPDERESILQQIDRMLGLCDELEVKLRASEEAADRLASAAVAELVG